MEKKSIGKVKMTLLSDKSMIDILDKMQYVADKMEEKENRSMAAGLWDLVSKKPVWGKRKNNA